MIIARIAVVIYLIINTLPVFGQSPIIFTPAICNFGAIAESDGSVSQIFTGKNTSDKPVVILDIISSCGCTVPNFSRKPILPGEKTEIRVTFDPQNRPGSFSKELMVYDSNRRKIATLTVQGEVRPREKSLSELYPVDAGDGLRLTQSLCTFSYLYHDLAAVSVVGIINVSNNTLHLDLRAPQNRDHLRLDYPQVLAPGQSGEISVTYLIPKSSRRYGTITDITELYVNGSKLPISITTHGVAVDNPQLSNEIYLPKAGFIKSILNFGILKRSSVLQKRPIILTNMGDGALTVRAVEVGGGVGCTLRPGCVIAPGESITAYATIDPSMLEYGALSGHLVIITNDPLSPMNRMRITAVIEE